MYLPFINLGIKADTPQEFIQEVEKTIAKALASYKYTLSLKGVQDVAVNVENLEFVVTISKHGCTFELFDDAEDSNEQEQEVFNKLSSI